MVSRRLNKTVRSDRADDYFNYTLRSERIRAGYTVEELAGLVGVSKSSITFYEGLRMVSNPSIARKIAVELKKRTGELQDIEGYKEMLFPVGLGDIVMDVKKERDGYPNDAMSHSVPLRGEVIELDIDDFEAEKYDMLGFLGEAMGTLDDRERKIIELRFGLGSNPARTLKEIGEDLGVTSERVRQIETKALDKLRESYKNKGFVGFLIDILSSEAF